MPSPSIGADLPRADGAALLPRADSHGRADLPSSGHGAPPLPSAYMVKRCIASGFDTLDLARLMNLPEAAVWNILARAAT